MAMCISACLQSPLLQKNIPADTTNKPLRRHFVDKVAVVMGATGAGKSRLSIDLATYFGGEIINSDKIQVYKGLDIIGNKITEEERCGVPHHLLGVIDPDADFTAEDYVHQASLAAEEITERGRLPIIVGGSNSFIEALVRENSVHQRPKFEFCFLWVDTPMPILSSFLSKRVDRMVERGLVEEARGFYEPNADYSRGIRRAIGLPEMDEFFRNEGVVDGGKGAELLKVAIDRIKENTDKLARRQVEKIIRLEKELGWGLFRLDATVAFLNRGGYAAAAWEKDVMRPSTWRVGSFICMD